MYVRYIWRRKEIPYDKIPNGISNCGFCKRLCGRWSVCYKKYDNIKEKGLFEQYQKQLFDSCLMENRENAIGLDGYFLRNNYRNVVVYGLGMYKEEFLKDVTKSTFDNIYYADKSAQTLSTSEQKVYGIEELTKQDFYDVIVVTSYNHAKEIEAELRAAGIKKDIISYSDLVINAPKER